jgi:hypothetical protein
MKVSFLTKTQVNLALFWDLLNSKINGSQSGALVKTLEQK